MRAVGQADRGAGAGNLFGGDDMGKIAHPGPAELFGHGDAQKAKLAHLAPELRREAVGAVDLRGHRLDAALRPTVDHLAQGVHILAQIERHRRHEHLSLLPERAPY